MSQCFTNSCSARPCEGQRLEQVCFVDLESSVYGTKSIGESIQLWVELFELKQRSEKLLLTRTLCDLWVRESVSTG